MAQFQKFHCAGNVGAAGFNGKGISGIAPNVKIMAVRFLTEKGQGTLDGAVKSIEYAVRNGAQVLSNSWGSEGDPNSDDSENVMLKDAIQFAMDNNVLFIAAAGNGRMGAGFSNDTDSKPALPASYSHDNIISVAAMDEQKALGAFSNWGVRTVDIGAPGVKNYSTVVGNKYSDTVIDIPGILTAHWDGTSMATPMVSGAAALYWTKNPNKTWREVKEAILRSAQPTSSISSKVSSGGRLDVKTMMMQ